MAAALAVHAIARYFSSPSGIGMGEKCLTAWPRAATVNASGYTLS
jgi:hypothetical protein